MSSILNDAKNVLTIEANAILKLRDYLSTDFENVVHQILQSQGRVVVTGVGKSALIGSKIVATLNSTGTPSIFMHAADAVHGDLGMVQQNDTVICLSYSGNTSEIKVLVPFIKNMGNKIVAITGNSDSFLAQNAHYLFLSKIEEEACPNNLAPTTSTTAQLALGDALAVCLLKARGFKAEDFAKYHPGGALGKQLYLKVEDLAAKHAKPIVGPHTNFKDVVVEISTNRLGVVAVVENNQILGVITDGDIRRAFQQNQNILELNAHQIMNKTPKKVQMGTLVVKATTIFEEFKISQLLVEDKGTFIGFIHFHDLLEEGII